jgi:hypothetical protein
MNIAQSNLARELDNILVSVIGDELELEFYNLDSIVRVDRYMETLRTRLSQPMVIQNKDLHPDFFPIIQADGGVYTTLEGEFTVYRGPGTIQLMRHRDYHSIGLLRKSPSWLKVIVTAWLVGRPIPSELTKISAADKTKLASIPEWVLNYLPHIVESKDVILDKLRALIYARVFKTG